MADVAGVLFRISIALYKCHEKAKENKKECGCLAKHAQQLGKELLRQYHNQGLPQDLKTRVVELARYVARYAYIPFLMRSTTLTIIGRSKRSVLQFKVSKGARFSCDLFGRRKFLLRSNGRIRKSRMYPVLSM